MMATCRDCGVDIAPRRVRCVSCARAHAFDQAARRRLAHQVGEDQVEAALAQLRERRERLAQKRAGRLALYEAHLSQSARR